MLTRPVPILATEPAPLAWPRLLQGVQQILAATLIGSRVVAHSWTICGTVTPRSRHRLVPACRELEHTLAGLLQHSIPSRWRTVSPVVSCFKLEPGPKLVPADGEHSRRLLNPQAHCSCAAQLDPACQMLHKAHVHLHRPADLPRSESLTSYLMMTEVTIVQLGAGLICPRHDSAATCYACAQPCQAVR